MSEINEILIVGGGTSGWLSAAILAKLLSPEQADGVKITLVESPNIPTIGVGEGTVPTLVGTLAFLGIDEYQFMRKCHATFKQAIKFSQWVHAPNDVDPAEFYYHLFEFPLVGNGMDAASCWIGTQNPTTTFANAVSPQGALCDAGRGPRSLDAPQYSRTARHAYHMDAGEFGQLLREHCTEKLGVKHISATVESVNLGSEGEIVSVMTAEAGELKADFFIDCSGFRSLMLGDALKVPFVDKHDMLFVDNALAMRVPYETPDQAIPSFTIATAQESGWTWDIGLSHRRGIGYVYSSDHVSNDKAEETLRNYIGPSAEGLEARRISLSVGYRQQFWEKNCVGIGFASGFAEPLEATAIMMVESMAFALGGQFPRTTEAMPLVAKKYNGAFRYRWDTLLDFIKLHYCISKREDSQFWLDNVDSKSISDELLEKLELWKHFPPLETDFTDSNNVFPLASYQYILYGMDFESKIEKNLIIQRQIKHAKKAMVQMKAQSDAAVNKLPSHRQLIEAIALRSSAQPEQNSWAYMSR